MQYIANKLSIFVVLILLTTFHVIAHPISITMADAVVKKNKVELQVSVYPEDFMLFYGLIPDANGKITYKDLVTAKDKHKDFLLKGLNILDKDGNNIAGKVVKVESKIDKAGIETDKLMKSEIIYHLDYLLKTAPSHLSFYQKFGSESVMLPSTMSFSLRQDGFPAEDPVQLTNEGNVQTFEFDWNRKPVEGGVRELSWQEREAKRKERMMGITSYTSIYSFIYINDHEVRLELLIPLGTLETWIDIDRNDKFFLEIEEQAQAQKKIHKFITNINQVKIDGLEVKPTLQRLDFYGVDFKDFAMRAKKRRLSTANARVGAILSYSTKGAPNNINIKWELFNSAVYNAKAAVYAYNKSNSHNFTSYNPHFKWKNPGKAPLPQITQIDTENEKIDDKKSAQVAGLLLKNVYRAFDYRDESDVYDAIEKSVDGELLSDIYLKIKKGLEMQEQGGAISKVKEIKITDSKNLSLQTNVFSTDLTWTVEGTVEHWGHIHNRLNQYKATVKVKQIESAWKIVSLKVKKQERLKYYFTLRKLD